MNISHFMSENFCFSDELNSPMYIQLAAFIRHQITLGIFKKNDRMATENELCTMLNISRTTVRLAMNELLEEGLLIRKRGRGSFITERKINRRLNSLYNFTESMREQNIEPHSEVISARVCEANETIAGQLQLPSGQNKVFRLERIRYGDDTPLLHETTYITYNLCPGIENQDFSKYSLYDVLKTRYGLTIYHASETLEAIIIEAATAASLKCSAGPTPGYRIERVSSLETGFVFEYTTSVTRADKCKFRVDMYSADHPSTRPSIGFSRQLER